MKNNVMQSLETHHLAKKARKLSQPWSVIDQKKKVADQRRDTDERGERADWAFELRHS